MLEGNNKKKFQKGLLTFGRLRGKELFFIYFVSIVCGTNNKHTTK